MKAGDIVFQAELIQDCVNDKSVVFMGDGDAMALTLNYLAKFNLLKPLRHSIVLDFDERIINSVRKFANEFDLNIETKLYNVIDPIPSELNGNFDFFYTNPPYGASNDGRSVISFID